MLHCHQILVRTIALGIGVANLSACGQQGSLYLPTDAVATKLPSTAASGAVKSPVSPPGPASP